MDRKKDTRFHCPKSILDISSTASPNVLLKGCTFGNLLSSIIPESLEQLRPLSSQCAKLV